VSSSRLSTCCSLDACAAELECAGLLTIGFDADGGETWTLTPKGAQVAREMVTSSEDDALELLSALLDATQS
jgi:hypothetical protein